MNTLCRFGEPHDISGLIPGIDPQELEERGIGIVGCPCEEKPLTLKTFPLPPTPWHTFGVVAKDVGSS